MTPEAFAENFHILADAPNGIEKLREMVFQLAVKGKLIAQNIDDEPASALLKKIKLEKEKLTKEGKIRRHKPLEPLNSDELPYDLPRGWEWTTLMEAGILNPRNDAPDELKSAFVPMGLVSDKYGVYPEFEERPWGEVKKGFTHFAEGDIGFAKITPCFQNGKSAVFKGIPNGVGAGTTELHIFRPVGGTLIPEYVWLYFKSPRFLLDGQARMTGSAGQKRVPRGYFAENPFPLPPLAEQKRIVAKADQLMTLCDELETRQQGRAKSRVMVNGSCLNALTSPDGDSAETAWKRISKNFELLYDCPENVGALRQAILQLAVQGRLVSQDPNDEPAFVLIERIEAERERLVKEGKIRKQKALPPVDAAEVPYELPEGWEWARLGDVTKYALTDKVEAGDVSDGTWILELEDIEKMTSRLLNRVRYPERRFKSTKNVFVEGDVLYGKLRPYLDKVLVADEPGVCSTEIIPIQAYMGIDPFYMRLFLKAPSFIAYANSSTHGMNLPRLGTPKARLASFALPPLAEQKRVVTKVDQLMALCDELEAKLIGSQSAAGELMGAVVNELAAA